MNIRQVRFSAPGQVQLIESPPDRPGDCELLLRTEYTVISPGTELAFLHQAPNTAATFPLVMGYTGVGIVEKVGRDVQGFVPGDRVAAALAHQSHQVVLPDTCRHVPAEVSARDAASWHLISIALQGVRKARPELGETAAVFGLGVIGHLAAQLLKAAGCTFVCGIDPVAWRRERCPVDATAENVTSAREAGPPRVREGGFDIVIEASGVPAAINDAFAAAARMGRVVLLGSTRGLTEHVNFYADVHKKGLTILGAHASMRPATDRSPGLSTAGQDHCIALELLARRRLDMAPVVDDWVHPQDAPSAYARLHERQEQLLTLGIDWTLA